MLQLKSKPPTKIEVIVHSGEKEEKTLEGKLLGVDRASDLAVLRLEGKLPNSLPFGTKRELAELQKVYIFGFPFSTQLGKNITVSESSVSSLRKDASGALEHVQVNGGMHPGNSGGPVVNALGEVVGVSVSGIRGTQINFAIPAPKVEALLEGRTDDVSAGEPFRAQAEVRMPIRCNCSTRSIASRKSEWRFGPASQPPTAPSRRRKPSPKRATAHARRTRSSMRTMSPWPKFPCPSSRTAKWPGFSRWPC